MESETPGPAKVEAEHGDVAAFTSTMPDSYVKTYEAEERAEHAAIVERRGPKSVHVERWRVLPGGGALACFVADDQPGLLALICAALLRQRLEVRVAQIYSRRTADASLEAVDLFWLRRIGGGRNAPPIEPPDLEQVASTLCQLIEAPPERDPESARVPSGDPHYETRVFFESGALREGKHLLVVESRDYPGLLLAITRALHADALEIVGSNVHTEGEWARDTFELQNSKETTFGPQRMAAICNSVIVAVRAGAKE